MWVDAVCECVRFRPDRTGIAEELRDHYEEHRKELLGLGCAPELAEQRALEAMGDAREVGYALDKVHKPWLGWLWELSRWLARALAVLALVTLFHTIGWEALVQRTRDELAWEEPPASAAKVELEHGTLWAAPGDVEKQPDGTTVAEVRLWLQMRDLLGVERYYGMRNWVFSYRDELGELPMQELDLDAMRVPASRYWVNDDMGTIGWTRCQRTVNLVLDGPPEWAEVSYPLSGRDWVLRVEWGAGT